MEKIIKNGIEYQPERKYYVAYPRSSMDNVKVGLFESFESCANAFPDSKPDTFVKEATREEVEKFFGLELSSFPFSGGTVRINEKWRRIEILFDKEIDTATRVKLNGNRFRFDPRVNGWHRELTNYSKHLVNYILDTKIFK